MNVKKNYIEGEDKTTKKKQQPTTHIHYWVRVGKKRIEEENKNFAESFVTRGIGIYVALGLVFFHCFLFLCANHRLRSMYWFALLRIDAISWHNQIDFHQIPCPKPNLNVNVNADAKPLKLI